MRLSEPGRFAAPALGALAALAACAAALWGLWTAMFTHNDQYRIETVSVSGDTTALTPEEIRSVSRLREGANIFCTTAAAARRRLTAASLNVADARVRKRLPSSVDIEIVPRRPIARLLDGEFIRALDRDGLVFPILERDEDKYGTLPFLYNGVDTPRVPLGSRLRAVRGTPTEAEGRLARALQLVRAVDETPDCPLRILEADVSDRIYLTVQTVHDRTVRFAWEEIPDEASIRRAVDTASLVLRHPDAQSMRRFDVLLTPTNRVVAAP